MEKKTILALLLILAVFWISSELLWKNKQQTPVQPPSVQKPAEQTAETIPEETIEPIQTKPEFSSIPETEIISDIEINNNIVLEDELMKIVFSNRGGVIIKIELKDYLLSDKTTLVNLIPEEQTAFNIALQSQTGNIQNLANTVFQYEKFENSVSFFIQTQKEKIEKKYTLLENYQLDFEIKVESTEELASYTVSLDSGIADTEEYLKMKKRDYKVVSQMDNSIVKYTLAKLKEKKEISGKIDWAAIRSKYFVMGIIPNELIDLNKLFAFQSNDSPAIKLSIDVNRFNFSHQYKLYLGPLINKYLTVWKNGFTKVQEGQGFLKPISDIFVWFLQTLDKVIPNYGINIILFSLVLKIILYPLTHKSFESSTKMQKIQPLMREVQTKYKSDPKTMQAELKKLYKEHGVSPLGGCLPMLLQMPVFFALYPILRYSIELRQTPFLWLPDLSEPDPYIILPIIMAVFMFIQQKLMTPSRQALEEMDDKQKAQMQSQKMMMYGMPIMMFFLFKSFPSGLVLYWTVFNIMSIFQQRIIKKKFK